VLTTSSSKPWRAECALQDGSPLAPDFHLLHTLNRTTLSSRRALEPLESSNCGRILDRASIAASSRLHSQCCLTACWPTAAKLSAYRRHHSQLVARLLVDCTATVGPLLIHCFNARSRLNAGRLLIFCRFCAGHRLINSTATARPTPGKLSAQRWHLLAICWVGAESVTATVWSLCSAGNPLMTCALAHSLCPRNHTHTHTLRRWVGNASSGWQGGRDENYLPAGCYFYDGGSGNSFFYGMQGSTTQTDGVRRAICQRRPSVRCSHTHTHTDTHTHSLSLSLSLYSTMPSVGHTRAQFGDVITCSNMRTCLAVTAACACAKKCRLGRVVFGPGGI
jgi:hypothetical protein